ncbi:MAG: RagB/SusD family nutrient uptake outer membrane protein [Flavobacterium sp.]|nr:RagB/SusD family nutrient uptake outer membrane protein [Flavobacterium sp.]
MKKIHIYTLLLFLVSSCSKFLDEKPDQKLSTISSLEDCQALLDRTLYTNERGSGALEAAADNYFFNMDFWGDLQEEQKNLYTWQPFDNYADYGFTGNDWSSCYDNIFRANTILESLSNIEERQPDFNNVKGQAYFLRAHNFLQAAWTWCLTYEKGTARNNLGLPIRKDPDFNKKIGRSNLEETYNQIIQDARMAITFLPNDSKHVYRSSKPAAYALLARIYLSMNEYDSVFKYANLCLELKSDLMDYNNDQEVDLVGDFPFNNFNREVIFDTQINDYLIFNGVSFIDTNLVNLYALEDLRRSAFFSFSTQYPVFKGSYFDDGNFAGITTAEVLLMKAEAAARVGKIMEGLESINLLLQNRINNSTFQPLSISDQETLVDTILVERRKELVMRGLRFMDIKRLNALGYDISLRRKVEGTEFVLPPNDLRFALPLPDDVVSVSGMVQNPR